ncbi:unnamed protein product [Arabidopsis lyrata]|nr:unnamed protein product [Arabidopsis lyrata]
MILPTIYYWRWFPSPEKSMTPMVKDDDGNISFAHLTRVLTRFFGWSYLTQSSSISDALLGSSWACVFFVICNVCQDRLYVAL